MRERLIELLMDSEAFNDADGKADAKHIADHLLANGVIVPPCEVGDKVWFVARACDEEGLEIFVGYVAGFSLSKESLWAYCTYEDGLTYWHKADDYGKTVFLTCEEAEQALKGGEW